MQATDIPLIQTELVNLYIHSSGYFPYTINNPIPAPLDEIKSRLPLAHRYFILKSNQSWSETFKTLTQLVSSNRYTRVQGLCDELLHFYQEYHPKVQQQSHLFEQQQETPLSQLDIILYQITLQFFHLMTISAETILEFLLKHLILATNNDQSRPKSTPQINPDSPLQTNPLFHQFFAPTPLTTPTTTISSPLYNLPLIDQIFTSTKCPFPSSLLLSATMVGQLENVRSLISLPMIDLNSRSFFLPSPVRTLATQRVTDAITLPDISKPATPGVNPATVPYSPNKLLPCPPFPWDTISTFLTTRLLNSPSNHHHSYSANQLMSRETINNVPLLKSYPLISLYYHILNQFGTCLYAASSLINGTSNRLKTQRQRLIKKDPVLYADEDSNYYPPAPPSDVSPWFFPPSSPTSVDIRSQQRSANGSKVPLIRWVYVAPEGNWRTLLDEEVIPFRENPETSFGTYMIAGTKQPRTLFTDAMDLISFFLAAGAEMILPLVAIIQDNDGKDAENDKNTAIPAPISHLSNYYSPHSVQYRIIAPIPIGIQDTLPNNALTISARIAVRLGLVRYQRWCNNASNYLLDAFMSTLGFDRLKNHAYHRYNGHHWPYAYLKRTDSDGIGNGDADDEKFTCNTVQELEDLIMKQFNLTNSEQELIQLETINPNLVNNSTKKAPKLSSDNTSSTIISSLSTNLHGKRGRSGIIRDITKDPIYLSLYALIMTTRTTQIKLGIQDVPTAVTYSPCITRDLLRLVRRYKRTVQLHHQSLVSVTATTPSKNKNTQNDKNGKNSITKSSQTTTKQPPSQQQQQQQQQSHPQIDQEESSGHDDGDDGDDGDDDDDNGTSTNPLQQVVPQHLLAPDLSGLALANRTHLPPAQLPKTLSIIHWFFSYHYTHKHFIDIAKKAMPKQPTATTSSSKKKSHDGPSFGKSSGSSIRRELDRRNEIIRTKEEKEQQRKQQELAMKLILEDSSPTAIIATQTPVVTKLTQTKPVPKPAKLTQQEVADIMGGGGSKKKKKQPAAKKVEPIALCPEPVEEVTSPITTPELQQPQEQQLESNNNRHNNANGTKKNCDEKINQPDYNQDLILDPMDFPKPLLFNNFYDSDDNLPLLMSLSRYHHAAATTESAITAEQITSNTTQTPNSTSQPNFTQPSLSIKKDIDETIVSPYFKTVPKVEQLLLESYKSAASHLDQFTRLHQNQLVLGSTGHISMEFITPEEATAQGFDLSNPEQLTKEGTNTTRINPIWTQNQTQNGATIRVNDETIDDTTTTINLIDHDHFLTKEMSQALEMASTLTSIVMLYCGQNTHRGYTDLQYQVKIGQPLTGLK